MINLIMNKFIPLRPVFLINVPSYTPLLLLAVLLLILIPIALFFTSKRKKKEFMVSAASFPEKRRRYNSNFLRSTSKINFEDLNDDLEPFGFAYYPPQDYFYSIMSGWQRECGYCELYDEGAAAFSMIMDCEPVYFEYEGKKWLIEFWKGQYGMNTGCEIGIYNTTGPDLNIPGVFNGTFYHSAEDSDHLLLGFSLWKNGRLIFSRKEKHWWLTGFKLGEFSYPSELVVNAEITFQSKEMLDAFVGGFLKTGYTRSDFKTYDNTLYFIFDKPRSPQPSTRTPFIEHFMQTNNKRNCEAYQYATGRLGNTPNRLSYVKKEAPKMYRKILNVGGTKDIFKSYELIKRFLGTRDIVNSYDFYIENHNDTGISDAELSEGKENGSLNVEADINDHNKEIDKGI